MADVAEKLFDAISQIAANQTNDLPYDQTIVGTIVDASNAEKGEYTISDSMSTFVAYSERTDFSVNQKVYVKVPNGDMLSRKYISGVYIENDVDNATKYISPMNDFVDLRGDITEGALYNPYGLLANDPVKLTTEVLWDSGGVEYRNYGCIGISAEFLTKLENLNIKSGSYGLSLNISYLDEYRHLLSKTFYFDSSSMFGDVYHFTSYYKQEKLFLIDDLQVITGIQLRFYQNNDFFLMDDERLPHMINEVTKMSPNLWVKNIEIHIGDLLSRYTDDTVRLLCNEDHVYSSKQSPFTRKCYVRWIHKLSDDTLIAIDEEDDLDEKFIVHWYNYVLEEGVSDPIAGNYWKEITTTDNNKIFNEFERDIQPSNYVQQDLYKVIIEFPIDASIRDRIESDSTFLMLMSELETSLETTNYLGDALSGVEDMIQAQTPQEINDIVTSLIENRTLYPLLYNNSAIISISQIIIEAKNKRQYYSSDVLTFTNAVDVAMQSVDMVKGLSIQVDSEPDGHNGIYRLYDETNNIINISEARKSRPMKAIYTSISDGLNNLNQAEEILWCFPITGSMIEPPLEGTEYDTNAGDKYFEVSNLAEASQSDAAYQQERLTQLRYLRPAQYMNDIVLTIDEMEIQFNDEIQSAFNLPAGQQTAQLAAIRNYYKILLEYLLNESYDSYIRGFDNTCSYGVIRRLGSEAISDVGEQLIETLQTFRIKSYYVDNCTNNTVYCLIKKQGRIYQASATLHFASLGNSGTEASFFLTMEDEYGKEISAIQPEQTVIIRPYLYDYDGQMIDCAENGVRYSWYVRPTKWVYTEVTNVETGATVQHNDEVYKLDISGPNAVLTYTKGLNAFLDKAGIHGILQAQTEYTISYNVADVAKTRVVKLTAFLPIAVKRDDAITHISGATRIVYDSNGVNPVYYKDPYQLYLQGSLEATEVLWELEGTDDELISSDSCRYYPEMTDNNQLIPNPIYFNSLKPISVLCYALLPTLSAERYLVWAQPILILQNKYGSAMLNNWDGSLQINEDSGTIMSAMMAAGIKNEDNSFSGILMGNVQLADESLGNKTGIGLYGLHEGQQSFGLNVDGTAFLGKSGKGRITFDGNKGLIRSGNYEVPRSISGTVRHGLGMQIDLDDSKFEAYGKTGAVIINTNQHGKPLFVIRDGNYDNNSNGNTLFYVASSHYDERTGKTHEANYFLQSTNYTNVNLKVVGTNITYPTGAYFNLEKGKLDIHGKAGRVSIYGDGSSNLFSIRGWNKNYDTVLFNVAPNRYFIQSLNYKPNQSGFKLNIATGQIYATDLNIKAGSAANGMISLTTTGSPYLSITTGKDYVAEYNSDTQTTSYYNYTAIELADVDAKFVSDTYYIRNPNNTSFALTEKWHETNTNQHISSSYYYVYNGPISDPDERDLEDLSAFSVVTTMYPETTWSFAATQELNAPKIYRKVTNRIVLDDSPNYTPGRTYYTRNYISPSYIINLQDNAQYYDYITWRNLQLLYYYNKTYYDAAGIAYNDIYRYYTRRDVIVNQETGQTRPEYTLVDKILDDSNNYIRYERNKYYYISSLGGFVLATGNYDPDIVYYLPIDEAKIAAKTAEELLHASVKDFYRPEKNIVDPATKFYNDGTHYYYVDSTWKIVPSNANYNSNYVYGLKLNGSNTITEISTDHVRTSGIYKPNTYYYVMDEFYEPITTWASNVATTSYYLNNGVYTPCTYVIQQETDTIKIFEPNKYYLKNTLDVYIKARDYKDEETYYRRTGTEYNVVTLCDENTTVYSTALASGNLYKLDVSLGNHGYVQVEAGTAFDANAEYYVRTTLSNNDLRNNIKLVNITKSKFELRSHNWNNSGTVKTGMYFYLSAGKNIKMNSEEQLSYANPLVDDAPTTYGDEAGDPVEIENDDGTITINDPGYDINDHGLTYLSEPLLDNSSEVQVAVGGGYITGYGFYQNITGYRTNGTPTIQNKYPKFQLDWRAGVSHYPIDVDDGAFRVYWNGKTKITQLDATRGRIGIFYFNDVGLFSFNPDALINSHKNRVGMALVPKGLTNPRNYRTQYAISDDFRSSLAPVDQRFIIGSFVNSNGGVLVSEATSTWTDGLTGTYTVYDPDTGLTIEYEPVPHDITWTLDEEGNYVIDDWEAGGSTGTLNSNSAVSLSYETTSYSFSVNRYGYMRAYGAYLNNAKVETLYGDKFYINTARINEAMLGGAFKFTGGKMLGTGITIDGTSGYLGVNSFEANNGKVTTMHVHTLYADNLICSNFDGGSSSPGSTTQGTPNLAGWRFSTDKIIDKHSKVQLTTNYLRYNNGNLFGRSNLTFSGTTSISGATTIAGGNSAVSISGSTSSSVKIGSQTELKNLALILGPTNSWESGNVTASGQGQFKTLNVTGGSAYFKVETGKITASGSFHILSGFYIGDGTSGTRISSNGNTDIVGTLTVSGTTTLGGTLTVNAGVTVGSSGSKHPVVIYGKTSVFGDFTVSGSSVAVVLPENTKVGGKSFGALAWVDDIKKKINVTLENYCTISVTGTAPQYTGVKYARFSSSAAINFDGWYSSQPGSGYAWAAADVYEDRSYTFSDYFKIKMFNAFYDVTLGPGGSSSIDLSSSAATVTVTKA